MPSWPALLPDRFSGHWVRGFIGRSLAGAIAFVLVLTVGAFVWLRNPPRPDPSLLRSVEASAHRPCSQIEIIGLRGYGDTLAAWSGSGADVFALTAKLKARISAQSLELYGLPYEQGSSPFGLPLFVPRDIPPAAAVLSAYVDARSAACPNERLVVIGQSEGAAVTHWAYAEVATKVAAVVLLGDPLHLPGATYNETLSQNGYGQIVVWLAFDPFTLSFHDRIVSGVRNVKSYCLPHDQVCDSDPLDAHSNTHLDYRLNEPSEGGGRGVLDRAAAFVSALLATG